MHESTVKKGWARVVFGDVVRQVRDRVDPEDTDLERYVAGEHMDTDDLRIRRWGLIGDGYLGPAFHMRFRPGHVLYGSRRTYLRKVVVADFEGVTANTTFVIEPKDPKVLLPELLPFVMQTESFHEHSVKQSKGSVNPYVNFSDLAWYEFALPPLEEQRRIAAAEQRATSAVEALKTALTRVEDVRQSSLNRHFNDGRQAMRDCAALGEATVRVNDGTHQPPAFTASGIPFLLVSNITAGRIKWEVEKHVSRDTFEQLSKTWRPQQDDVLYSLVGSYGVPAMVDRDAPFTFQRHIGIIRTKRSKLLPKFLYWYLMSPSGFHQANLRAEGLAQKTITLGALRSFRVPVPSLERQGAIVTEIEAVQEAVSSLERRIDIMKDVQRGLVATGLRGPR